MFNYLKNKIFKSDDFQEGAESPKELLKVSMPDEDLVREIDNDISSSQSLYSAMKTIQDTNENYYLGTQLDPNRFNYEIPTAENLLYMATETILSIITSQRRDPVVMAGQNTDESRDLAGKTRQFLGWKWNDEDMKIKFEDWTRHSMLYRIGVLKLRWNLEQDDFEIQVIRPQRIMIDKDATDELNAKFIIEFKEDILADIEEMFPKAKKELNEQFGEKKGTIIKYIEYWTNEFVVWKVGSILLEKRKNPNWNWDEKDRKDSLKKLKKRWIEKTKDEKLKNILLNFFNEPRKPYVILSLKNLGDNIYASTGDFDQGRVIQDIINRRKRLIDRAAIKAVGREIYSGSYISKEEAKKSISNPNSPIWMEKGKASDAVTHIAPAPVSPVLFNDLMDSKSSLDNVMGIHGTTRGEQGPKETATGRTLLREGDFGRIDLSVRRIDKKLELLYGLMMQFVKVYYTEDHFTKILGGEGAVDYLKYSQNDVEDGQEVIVKSELTVDKATQRENVVQRMQSGLLDPLTYFEKFEETNPKEEARRLVLYNLDPKLYLQEFCSTGKEGADDSASRAEQENEQLEAGEEVPPYEGVDELHLKTHSERVKKSDFKELEPDIQMNFSNHIRGEIDILRQKTQTQPQQPQQQV